MLICPECKFENPSTNNFCQNCGSSLCQKVCPECGTPVAVNAKQCHSCDAECGTVWWAIIAYEDFAVGEAVEVGEATQSAIPAAADINSELLPGCYLDQQQRYQLLEPLPALSSATNQVCVRVLDQKPYEISPLKAMLSNPQQGISSLLSDGIIKNLAKPYVALQAYRHLGIPEIHDAWEQGNIQVVLIEDRSDWQPLVDLWREDSTSSSQILHCFNQMTKLWALLEPYNCLESLLDLSNLRLDEDCAVALQELYVKSPYRVFSSQDAAPTPGTSGGQSLTIKTLGGIWQALFRHSQRTQFGSMVQLLGDLELGKIQTLPELQSRLQAIAAELQTSASVPVVTRTAAPTMLQLDDPEDSAAKSDDMPTVVLPMQLISLEDAGRTDVGRQRHHNEDYFGVETKITKVELPKSRTLQARGLYILCDGMGGHAGGEVASELAVNTLRQYFQDNWTTNQLPTEESIREAVRLANRAIYDRNQKDARSGVGRMGTTLVMLLINDTKIAVAHVGDSRLYSLTRKLGLKQVTVDHEVGQREISRGVEASVAYNRPDAYQLTQALGPRDDNSIKPDVQFFEINEDTLFILASDGLSDNDLLTNHSATHLEPLLASGAYLERGVKELIDLANQDNGHDNITAVLIRAKVRAVLESQLLESQQKLEG